MYHNFRFQNIDEALPVLAHRLLNNGDANGSRNGEVREMTHVGITLDAPWQREIAHLAHVRKTNVAAQIAETMWVLSGRNDVEFLSHYLPRSPQFSDDGKTWRAGYGPRIRNWGGVDQVREVLNLLREDPLSRRAVISIWDPAADFGDYKDIPCNNWLSFSSRFGKLDLMVGIRSNDLIWGWSHINQFEWSALLEIMAGILGLKVGGLHFSTTSLHVYAPHWKKADDLANADNFETILTDSPRFDPRSRSLSHFDHLSRKWFEIEEEIRLRWSVGMKSTEISHMIDDFEEPMLRSWLNVLNWWWNGVKMPRSLKGTRLELAALNGMTPVRGRSKAVTSLISAMKQTTEVLSAKETFTEHVVRVHTEKDAAYKGSWKRRGEMLGIMANIARKIDRLGNAETSDETQADTAMDLFVYLVKYRDWLSNSGIEGDNELSRTNAQIRAFTRVGVDGMLYGNLENVLKTSFDRLETAVTKGEPRLALVSDMANFAFSLAFRRWQDAQKDVDEYQGADADDARDPAFAPRSR